MQIESTSDCVKPSTTTVEPGIAKKNRRILFTIRKLKAASDVFTRSQSVRGTVEKFELDEQESEYMSH